VDGKDVGDAPLLENETVVVECSPATHPEPRQQLGNEIVLRRLLDA